MVYNTQNYWVFELCPLPSILETKKKTMFQKLNLFPSSGKGGGKTPTQLGPLERANLNHWRTSVRFTTAIIAHLIETPVSETLRFLVSRIPDDEQSPKTQ
jgi:hypothetical protein